MIYLCCFFSSGKFNLSLVMQLAGDPHSAASNIKSEAILKDCALKRAFKQKIRVGYPVIVI